MSTSADWIIVSGFVLVVLGIVFRTVIMMNAADARSAGDVPLIGGDFVRAYRVAHPASWWPRIAQVLIAAGLVLLIAGLLLEFR